MGMGVKHYLKDGEEHKVEYHKMLNGQRHCGKTHISYSVSLYHYGELAKTSQNNAR